MDTSQPFDSQSLLAHAAWVHRLAHSLVADPNAADDLAQDTWLAVLQHPPRHGENPQGWLATVLENLRRQSKRGEMRRSARERHVARTEAQPDTLDVLARAGMHRELVEAVMTLREPFRTTVLLRFFDELPPRRIAAELDIPVHTVNSRLQRGLAELREKLDERRGGDRSAWLTALAPLARQGAANASWAPSSAIGALVMNAKWKVAVALVLALIGVLGVRSALESDPEPSLVESHAIAPAHASDRTLATPLSSLSSEDASTARIAAAAAEPAHTTPSVPLEPVVRLHGRVLDARAEPVAGLRVAFHADSGNWHAEPAATVASREEHAEFTAESDRNGDFEMDAPAVSGVLWPNDPAYMAVMSGLYAPHASIDPVLVVSAVRPLAGRVRSVDGEPLLGAHIQLEVDAAFSTRFAHILDASMLRRWIAETDARGMFDLASAPSIEGARLRTGLDGYEDDVRPAPELADRAIEIVLKRAEPAGHTLIGDVRAPDGTPVRAARVALGAQTVLTDDIGRFAFDLALGDADRLVAVKRGYLPAELAADPGTPRWPAFARLRFGASPSFLAGRIVDSHGTPLSKVRLWLGDPTYFGMVDGGPTNIESLLGTARTRGEIDRARAGTGADFDGPDLLWSFVETDDDGHFRIEGLLARTYRLRAMDVHTLVHVDEGPFTAGDGAIEIVLPTSEYFDKVTGHVLARDGEPIEGVRVTAVRRVAKIEVREWSNSRTWGGASTLTDAEGRFELEHVAREGIFLAVHGDPILGTWFDFPSENATTARTYEGIEVRAVRRCHLQVELEGDVARADAFAVLDASGQRLELSIIRGGNDDSSSTARLIAGRSAVIAVGEGGVTLVLLSKEKEVERQPLALVPRQLSVIRR